MMRMLRSALWASLCVVVLAAPATRAQQQTPDQSSGPIPAYHSPLATAADNGETTNTQELAPDTNSLSGAQYLSLGTPITRSYWQPRFNLFTTADSNALETANTPGWVAWTSVSGGIDIHQTSGNNSMILSYTSGGMFTNSSGVSNGVIQGLSFSDKVSFHRASITFFDDLNYLPESSFGFGGLGGSLLQGSGSPGLGLGFTPGQSILTGRGQNLGNSFVTEVDTFLTPRASLTFVGGYSLVDYFDNNLLNYNDVSFRGGYNYQMNRGDTIAVLYTFSGFRYGNFNQSINDHTVQLSYGRRVTGRLAFQIAAGPQVAFSRIPINGGVGSVGGGAGSPTSSTTRIYWSLTTSLQWQAGRTGLGLNYNHGVGGGSGVLAGSLADVVRGSVTRQVSRTFSSGLTAGYSRNQGLAIGNLIPTTQTYDYWFVGGNLTHPLGRSLGLTFSYQMQYQNSNAMFCIGPTCGTSVVRNMISVGVGWHERPLLF